MTFLEKNRPSSRLRGNDKLPWTDYFRDYELKDFLEMRFVDLIFEVREQKMFMLKHVSRRPHEKNNTKLWTDFFDQEARKVLFCKKTRVLPNPPKKAKKVK